MLFPIVNCYLSEFCTCFVVHLGKAECQQRAEDHRTGPQRVRANGRCVPPTIYVALRSTTAQANHGIGRFIKGRKIGAGGFGCCFLCTSAESGNRYVIKEVSTRGMSATDQDAALREVNILKKLRHPNIIAYKDSYKSDGKLSIIMEYASGGDV